MRLDPISGLEVGSKLEAWDIKTPQYMCAATISEGDIILLITEFTHILSFKK